MDKPISVSTAVTLPFACCGCGD